LKSSQTTAAYWENYAPRRGSGLASNPRKPRNKYLEEVSKVIDDVSEATTDVSEVTDDHREVTPMAFEATADDHKSYREHTKRSWRAMEVADGQVDAGGDTSRLTAAEEMSAITATGAQDDSSKPERSAARRGTDTR
jgi:hypothetical protein